MPTIDSQIEVTSDEANFLFIHHMKLAIACWENLPDAWNVPTKGFNEMHRGAVLELIRCLEEAYATD